MKLRHWTPLLGFLLPNLVIGYGFLIPRSVIAGVNQLTVGFGITLAAACLTYWTGVRAVLRESSGAGDRK